MPKPMLKHIGSFLRGPVSTDVLTSLFDQSSVTTPEDNRCHLTL